VKPCVQCGTPCNILQSTANVINNMQAPVLCPKCVASPKPCAQPCAKPSVPSCSKCGKSH
jgi:hypothetical protein